MKIGLTGGIGCGKSTVVGLFREAGWSTIDSDTIVRELLATDADVQAALLNRWGTDVFDESGCVNRQEIASRVFSEASELKWLEGLLHPLVRERWERVVAKSAEANWLVEIPLLFEKRLETTFDLTVCVSCAPNVVESRMLARGYSGAEIEQRRAQQMPLRQKVERADHLISNSGSLDFLKQQTARLIAQMTAQSSILLSDLNSPNETKSVVSNMTKP
ncbi:MAG: dephospho-CoA kinase [Opitutales bacterium]|jgi:dephospho-CoA kinase